MSGQSCQCVHPTVWLVTTESEFELHSHEERKTDL